MLNILLVGVGGQGIVLATRLLAEVAFEEGLEVKVSEIHGMSQRGGSVFAMVRAGKEVNSPIVSLGEVDLLLALEELEGLRWIEYLKPQGKVILNSHQIYPVSVALGQTTYPPVIEALSSKGVDYYLVDANQLARKAGSLKAANVILIGYASRFLPFKPETYEKVIRQKVKERFVELNLKAFALGRENA